MAHYKYFSVATTCAIAFIFAGCSRPAELNHAADGEVKAQLSEVVDLLKIHEENKKKPARSVRDLKPYENAYPSGFAVIESGDVIVLWGKSSGEASHIIAHQKQVPSSGGWAAFGDGSVKEVSAEDFASLRK